MFVVAEAVDVIRIPPSLLGCAGVSSSATCLGAIHGEIDRIYPNRVLIDCGLVVSRYGKARYVSDGVCVAGDGGSHHRCHFSLVVFRPFVEEVITGRIYRSTPEGVYITLGFFENIFVPAYWMLRPSVYEPELGLWVWTPQYDDDDDAEDMDEQRAGDNDGNGSQSSEANRQRKKDDGEKNVAGSSEPQRFEMELNAEIRFKVKSIQYTQLTKTVKGLQATTTTTSSSSSSHQGHSLSVSTGYEDPSASTAASGSLRSTDPGAAALALPPPPVRRQRSSTMDETFGNSIPSALPASSTASQQQQHQQPPPMYIVGSICEDGLGLTWWWTNDNDDDDDDDDGDCDDGGDGNGEEESSGVENEQENREVSEDLELESRKE
jgi:DNA-directed RNA polymerase III subunit RPC8